MNPSLPPFSVLMAVHAKEDPALLHKSLDSLCQQTLKAERVVMVCDGELTPQLEDVISEMQPKLPLKLVRSPENLGLGKALQLGMRECETEIIARADTDDISLPQRFEKQVDFLVRNVDIDLVGSSILEFDADPKVILSEKKVPLNHDCISVYAKWRNPINHMSVVFRKSSVCRAGGYSDYRYAQDYHLWVKMLMTGCKFANLPDPLVLASAGGKMISKRGGIKHFLNEFKMQKEFLNIGFTTPLHFVLNSVTRLAVRIVPNSWRMFIYLRLLRKPSR
jgi:glycosyltransferase involved in cell wall biosynthesis